MQETVAVMLDEKFRRESFAIHTARRGDGAPTDHPLRFSVKGESDPNEFKPNLSYRLWGRWEPENNFGPTFNYSSFAAVVPHSKSGVVAYLRQARHVGEATAFALWDAFGGEAVRVLREEPERASEAVGKRFPVEKAREASDDLKPLVAAENLTIELHTLFENRGFGRACVREAIRLWGAAAVEILRRDPHKAMALRGVGFKKADAFYLDLGKSPDKLKRQALCLAYAALKEAEQDGHVWTSLDNAVTGLKANIAGANVRPEKAAELARRAGVVRVRKDCPCCHGTGEIE